MIEKANIMAKPVVTAT
jgi:pyruvate kinase